jgi:hypothetical protein
VAVFARSEKTRDSQVAKGMFHFPFENKENMAARASQRKDQRSNFSTMVDRRFVMIIPPF